MPLKLSQEEQVIKSWDFASISVGAEKSKTPNATSNMNLTVTDKRMILQSESEQHLARKEVLLKEVAGVGVGRSLTRTKPPRVGAIILLLLSIVGFVFAFTGRGSAILTAGIILGVACLIISIALFCIKGKEIIAFELSIYSKASSANIIDAYYGGNVYQENRKNSQKNLVMQISLSKEAVYEIADTIGALIAQHN